MCLCLLNIFYQIGPRAHSPRASQLTCVSVKILTDVILVFCLHSIFKANPYIRKHSNREFARTFRGVRRQFYARLSRATNVI